MNKINTTRCLIILILLTYLLTYSMVQSTSWEANWFAASHEIPRILWNPKVHYSTHKRPPPVSILGQPNPVHIPTSHILEILPNIIHPSTPRSPQWSPSLRFPHQDPIHPALLTHMRHMPSPSNQYTNIEFQKSFVEFRQTVFSEWPVVDKVVHYCFTRTKSRAYN